MRFSDSVLRSGRSKCHFWHLKTGTFAKSDQFVQQFLSELMQLVKVEVLPRGLPMSSMVGRQLAGWVMQFL